MQDVRLHSDLLIQIFILTRCPSDSYILESWRSAVLMEIQEMTGTVAHTGHICRVTCPQQPFLDVLVTCFTRLTAPGVVLSLTCLMTILSRAHWHFMWHHSHGDVLKISMREQPTKLSQHMFFHIWVKIKGCHWIQIWLTTEMLTNQLSVNGLPEYHSKWPQSMSLPFESAVQGKPHFVTELVS